MLITSEGRLWPLCREGGARRDLAASGGGVEVSGVSHCGKLVIMSQSECLKSCCSRNNFNRRVLAGPSTYKHVDVALVILL